MIKKNKGIIRMQEQLINESSQELLDVAFSGIFVRSVGISTWGMPEYFCYSSLFDPVEEGCIVPEYEIIISEKEGKYSREINKLESIYA